MILETTILAVTLVSAQPSDFDASVQREALKEVVAIAHHANNVWKQQAEKSVEERRAELVRMYIDNKITAREYYELRAKFQRLR